MDFEPIKLPGDADLEHAINADHLATIAWKNHKAA